jgi:hypothetical protein
MRLFTIVLFAVVALASAGEAQQAPGAGDFRRSDPRLLSATGRPQLVEFYHPT